MGEFGKRWPRLIGRAFDVLAHLDQITIGAINGYAVGGGWSFVLAFDFAIAVEGAEFWVPEVDLDVPYRGAPASVLAARTRAVAREGSYSDVPSLQGRGVTRDGRAQPRRQTRRADARGAGVGENDGGEISRRARVSKRDINAVFFGQRLF